MIPQSQINQIINKVINGQCSLPGCKMKKSKGELCSFHDQVVPHIQRKPTLKDWIYSPFQLKQTMQIKLLMNVNGFDKKRLSN